MQAHQASPIHARRRAQRGFTMIELSIAVLIALFLIGGLLAVVQTMKRTSLSQGGLAQLQDSERVAMTLLTDVIQAAGYYPDPTVRTLNGALPAAGVFANNGQSVFGVENATAGGDSVTVRYLTAINDGIINCVGGSNTGAATLIYNNAFSIDNTNSLVCSVNGGAAVRLIDSAQGISVQSLQILYGVKTDLTTSNLFADSYLRADEMTAVNWRNVLSVRITLSMNNPLFGQPGQLATVQVVRVIGIMAKAGVNT